MPYSFVLSDNVVVSSEEFNEKLSLGAMSRFAAASKNDPAAELTFREGSVKAVDLMAEAADPLEFESIGIGRPLSLEILAFYTGNVPFRLGLGKPDLLVTSAIKSVETYDAQPKSVNQLVKNVRDRQYLRPSAEAEGSAIVYYTSSLVNSTLTCDINLVADTFDEQALNHLSSLLKTASGLPVLFAGVGGPSAMGIALAGSVLANLVGNLGKAFLESKAFLRDQIELRFATPDFFAVLPGTIYVYNRADKMELGGYKPRLLDGGTPQQRMVMMNDNGNEYEGDAPYIILSLDGRERKDLNDYAPKLASAALLEQFMGVANPVGHAVETLKDAMELYNDFTFRQKAINIQQEIATLDEGSATYESDKRKLEEVLKAYTGNIRNELFTV